MMRPLVIASAFGLMATSPIAAADLSYSYVEGGAGVSEVDTAVGEQDSNDWDVVFSYEIMRFLHVFGGYGYSELDDLPVEEDVVHAGVGVNYDFSDRKSLYFNLAGITADAELDTGLGTISADDDGYSYSLGYREANNRLEFGISAEHVEFSDSDYSDTWVSARLRYRITDRFQAGGTVNFAGDESGWKIDVRYYLPSRFDRR
jgi:hypothetical protein